MAKYKLNETDYRITICDHILDNGYGQIGLTEVERKIERLPLFKRLHSVSQLGLVNWVFPCALHTRYTHSIGVMHVASQMAEHINSNKGFAFFNDAEIQIIRLAGMLHDIGHYPLSHNVEQVYKDIDVDKVRRITNDKVYEHLDSYINCPDFLNPRKADMKRLSAAEKRDKYFKSFSGSNGFHHEAIGNLLITSNEELFDKVKNYFVLLPNSEASKAGSLPTVNKFFAKRNSRGLKKEYSEDDINEITKQLLIMIGNMVIGNYAYDESRFDWSRKYSAMIQLIHSELDADNLDYLLRDASFSGTSYGIMDMSVLMNCLTVSNFIYEHDTDPAKNKNRYVVGIKAKGIGCVEQFLINKYLAYSQMTLSKYVSILEAMLSQIAKEWLNADKDYRPEELKKMVSSDKTSENYLLFTDSFILRKIFDLSSNGSILSPLPKHIVSYLKNYSAFNLCSSDGNSECICTGTNEKEILDNMSRSKVYKDFDGICKTIGDYTGKELKDQAQEKGLFAFRFEKYALTKQLPNKVFNETYAIDTEVANPELRFDMYYYRLGNGIPILKEEEYQYDKNIYPCKLPQLSVDCEQSLLHEIFPLQFVCLREYNIDDYVYSTN